MAALPVSPEVAARMQAVFFSSVIRRLADSSWGSIWRAMSLKALVGPCHSSRHQVRPSTFRRGAMAGVSNFSRL